MFIKKYISLIGLVALTQCSIFGKNYGSVGPESITITNKSPVTVLGGVVFEIEKKHPSGDQYNEFKYETKSIAIDAGSTITVQKPNEYKEWIMNELILSQIIVKTEQNTASKEETSDMYNKKSYKNLPETSTNQDFVSLNKLNCDQCAIALAYWTQLTNKTSFTRSTKFEFYEKSPGKFAIKRLD